MSPDDDRIDDVLARILEVQGANGSADVEAILTEHPDLEAPLRARLRVLRMLDALHASRSGAPVAPSVLASLSRAGRGVRPVSLPEPPGEGAPPVILPQAPSGSWGRYAVQGEIARGGVGVVLKARDPDLGREVALKILREEYASRPDVLQRFVEEAQIGGQLQHPGVVPVYELGMGSDRQPFFVMKLVKGRTLASLIAERASPESERPRFLSIYQAVCQTLAYAHERRIVHRDLKPSNVMVGAFGEVQVFDWGMAKVLPSGGAADDARETGTDPTSIVQTVRSASGSAPSVEGSVLGTPQYMAPEQARGQVDHLDERADVFSLGAILCEILTGKPPYTGTDREVLVAAAQARLEPALERLAACGADPELVALAKRCLAPERADRPRHASELAREITTHLASLEARARKAEVAEGEARVLVEQERRARRLTLSLSAAVLALVLLGGGGWTWIASQRRSRAEGVERQVELALTEATRLRGQAEAAGTPDALPVWREALSAARRAEALAASGDADPATQVRVESDISSIAEAQHRAKLADGLRRRDDAMAERLDEIRALCGETWDWKATSAAYAGAFEEYLGDDLEATGIDEAASRIGRSGVREQLVLALDFWTRARSNAQEPQTILPDLLARGDTDPWRARLRGASGDLQALRTMATQAQLDVLGAQDLLMLADRLGGAGDPEQAAALALEVWQRHPDDFWACFCCAQWNHRSTPPRFQEAARFYTAALSVRPRSAVVRNNFGCLLFEGGDREAAGREWREAIRLDPANAQARSNLGNLLRKNGDVEGAIVACRQAIQLDPTFAAAHQNLLAALILKGDLEGAIAEGREAARLGPTMAGAINELARALDAKDRFEEALVQWQIAVQLDPALGIAHNNLGSSLLGKGRLDEAIVHFRTAINLDSTEPTRHFNLAAALEGKADFDGAILEYRAAIQVDPKLAAAYLPLGNLLWRRGDLDGAMTAFREAARLDPRDARARANFGSTLKLTGDIDGAIAAYRDAIRVDATLAAAHWNLGLALRARGQLRGSLESLREGAVLKSPPGPEYRSPAQLAQQLQYAERLVAAAERVPAFARGEVKATTAQEALDMGQAGYLTGSYAASALAGARALALEPSLGEDLSAGHRYNAACSAALAGAGKGTDTATLDDAGRARWRWQALEWLRADLDAWKKVTDTKVARATLEHWRKDADLAVLRDDTALARASAEDAAACRALWRDVEQTLEKLAAPK